MTTTLPAQLTCHVCHRIPAQVFSVRRHVGMIVLQRFVKLRQPMCRDHALHAVRSYTAATLWQGWWGYISFFVNWFVLLSNAVVAVRASRLGQPRRGAIGPLGTAPGDPFAWMDAPQNGFGATSAVRF